MIVGKKLDRSKLMYISLWQSLHIPCAYTWITEAVRIERKILPCCKKLLTVLVQRLQPTQTDRPTDRQTDTQRTENITYWRTLDGNNFGGAQFIISTNKATIFVGFYLMFVMNSTAFWLLLTVGILNMHNKDPKKCPPRWLQSLAVNVLAKLVCMKVSQPNTKRRNRNLGDLMLREFNNKEITDTETDGISWMKVAKIFDRFLLGSIHCYVSCINVNILVLLPHKSRKR